MVTIDRMSSLDLSRTLAIMMVLAVHLSQTFPLPAPLAPVASLGRFGVQLFFIVSAYTMCVMWTKRAGEQAPVYKFYMRRLLRIAPLYWLAVFVYLLAYGVGPSGWAPEGVSVAAIAMNLTFTHSLAPEAMNAIIAGGWSISVEMAFYLCFPLLAAFALRGSPRLTILSAAIWHFTYSFITADMRSPGALFDDFLYLNPLNQMPAFLMGIAAFQSRNRSAFTEWPLLLLWLALAIAAVGVGLIPLKSGGFIVIVIALYGVFVAIQRTPDSILRLAPKAATLIGQRSYGIYLSHFLVISFLGGSVEGREPGLLYFAEAYALALLASYAVAARIEDVIHAATAPVRRMLLDRRRPSSPSTADAAASQSG